MWLATFSRGLRARRGPPASARVVVRAAFPPRPTFRGRHAPHLPPVFAAADAFSAPSIREAVWVAGTSPHREPHVPRAPARLGCCDVRTGGSQRAVAAWTAVADSSPVVLAWGDLGPLSLRCPESDVRAHCVSRTMIPRAILCHYYFWCCEVWGDCQGR